jgi:hypothetical protein
MVVSCDHIEETLENGRLLGASEILRGAFYIISFDITTKAAKQHGLGDIICRRIGSMLDD